MDEKELARRFVADGDELAFSALYRLHTPVMFRIAARMLGGEEAAAEIIQESWIRAAQRLASFRWESRLQTWLIAIVINCCREELRRGNAAKSDPADECDLGKDGPPLNARIDLERALARLPEGFREILLLHDVEGFTHDEIAQVLAIEPSTSRSQLSRARAAMREWLEQT
jgi:RNA polymerase sigma-70 factor (ECF subfamily)